MPLLWSLLHGDAQLAAIEEKVRKRAAWIRRQQRYFIQFLPRTPDRQYVAGETHLYSRAPISAEK